MKRWLKIWWYFWFDFYSIFHWFWDPKMAPKSHQNRPKNHTKNHHLSDVILTPFLMDFGTPRGGGREGAKLTFRGLFWLLNLSWGLLGPRWPPDLPKTAPGSDFGSILNDFWPNLDQIWWFLTKFGPNLDQFWKIFYNFGTKLVPIFDCFAINFLANRSINQSANEAINQWINQSSNYMVMQENVYNLIRGGIASKNTRWVSWFEPPSTNRHDWNELRHCEEKLRCRSPRPYWIPNLFNASVRNRLSQNDYQ